MLLFLTASVSLLVNAWLLAKGIQDMWRMIWYPQNSKLGACIATVYIWFAIILLAATQPNLHLGIHNYILCVVSALPRFVLVTHQQHSLCCLLFCKHVCLHYSVWEKDATQDRVCSGQLLGPRRRLQSQGADGPCPYHQWMEIRQVRLDRTGPDLVNRTMSPV